VKSRNSSQCNETFLVMSVRPVKRFGFQSAAENLMFHINVASCNYHVYTKWSSKFKQIKNSMFLI